MLVVPRPLRSRRAGDRKEAEGEGFRRLAGYIFGGNKTKK
jgi:hypothetical protein